MQFFIIPSPNPENRGRGWYAVVDEDELVLADGFKNTLHAFKATQKMVADVRKAADTLKAQAEDAEYDAREWEQALRDLETRIDNEGEAAMLRDVARKQS